jgi:hypothetical protein
MVVMAVADQELVAAKDEEYAKTTAIRMPKVRPKNEKTTPASVFKLTSYTPIVCLEASKKVNIYS